MAKSIPHYNWTFVARKSSDYETQETEI